MIFRWLAPLLVPALALAQDTDRPGSRAGEPMVDLAKVAPHITIELRYTTERNLAKFAIYPKNARCFVRKSVAHRLIKAQGWLTANGPKGTRIKIWDAWRPAWAHERLWEIFPNKEYVANPRTGGSLHTWGVAVDATLCDAEGRDLAMPTDFDVLTTDAKTRYDGNDPEVRRNLSLLQSAMKAGGFQVLRDEWWHFVAHDWQTFAPTDLSLTGDGLALDPASPAKPALNKAPAR